MSTLHQCEDMLLCNGEYLLSGSRCGGWTPSPLTSLSLAGQIWAVLHLADLLPACAVKLCNAAQIAHMHKQQSVRLTGHDLHAALAGNKLVGELVIMA